MRFKSLARRLKLATRIFLGRPIPHQARVNIPPISPEEIEDVRQFFPLDKFFIFGHARSGTTMLARLARLHPDVHCNYQAHFFTRQPLLQALVEDQRVESWLNRPSNRWNRGKDLSPLILRAVADLIMEREARDQGARIVGDKSPNSLMDGKSVQLMHNVFPDGRLLYIVRDGRDTAISHRFQAFIDLEEHLSPEDVRIRSDFIQNPEPFLHGERSLFGEKTLRQSAESWVRNVTQTHDQGQALYGARYLAVRYEDLLAHTWDEMCKIWHFLGASPTTETLKNAVETEMNRNPDADWQKQKAGQIARALEKGKAGNWHSLFTHSDIQLYEDIAGETLKAWGYPLSDEC